MRIIFCDSVIDRKLVEPIYEEEYIAAQANGMNVSLISHEALVDEGNIRKAISLVKSPMEKEKAIYRGWMMRPEAYAKLYEGLLAKNIELINTPDEYKNCHLFPESYEIIEAQTPKSVVVPEEEMRNPAVLQATLSQIPGAAIVKDYVKSLKHHWEEACYIPDSSDWEAAYKVINRFIELQGSSLVGGLILREYVNLKKIAHHSESGMPLSEEYRLFFLNGKVHQIVSYWDEMTNNDSLEIPEEVLNIGRKIQSNFFTIDLARLANGNLTIMELGDGQVAGLPEQTNVDTFYGKFTE